MKLEINLFFFFNNKYLLYKERYCFIVLYCIGVSKLLMLMWGVGENEMVASFNYIIIYKYCDIIIIFWNFLFRR